MTKNNVAQFTKIRTADLSAMTDLLTDSYMAFEDIFSELSGDAETSSETPIEQHGSKVSAARELARVMVKELRNWKPNPSDSTE